MKPDLKLVQEDVPKMKPKRQKKLDEFANLLAWLVSRYPNAKNIEHKRLAAQWFDEFKRYDLDVIKEGMVRVKEKKPDWFPTNPQLKAAVARVQAGRSKQQRQSKHLELERIEDAKHDETVDSIAVSSMDEWIKEGKTVCERLERKFLAESRAMGTKGDYRTSDENVKQRFRDLYAAFDEHVAQAARRHSQEYQQSRTKRQGEENGNKKSGS